MCNNSVGCEENGGKVPLASNQVVGSSSLSGRTIFIKDLTRFRKFESSHRKQNIKVVIGGRWTRCRKCLHQQFSDLGLASKRSN